MQNEQDRRHWAALSDTCGLQGRCTSVFVDCRVVTGGAVEAADEAVKIFQIFSNLLIIKCVGSAGKSIEGFQTTQPSNGQSWFSKKKETNL